MKNKPCLFDLSAPYYVGHSVHGYILFNKAHKWLQAYDTQKEATEELKKRTDKKLHLSSYYDKALAYGIAHIENSARTDYAINMVFCSWPLTTEEQKQITIELTHYTGKTKA